MLQSIVQRMPDGLVILGVDGAIRFANPAAEELFGRSLAELKGLDLGAPGFGGDRTEIEIVRPRGGSVTAELRTVDAEIGDESVRLVALRDVTDRKHAQQRAAQLERERLARAQAEASSHAKSEFLATMSHELRTPLNAVIGYAQLLDLGIAGSLTDAQRTQVARIRGSARHLLGLVNEVLDLAKVEAGQLSVQCKAASAAEAINAALALAGPQADARGIVLSEAPESPDVLYEGDDDRVRQILVNLLNNAVKFTPSGGSVMVGCDVARVGSTGAHLPGSGPWVRLRVIDTGVGIPEDQLMSIFDPFVQVEHGHTRSADGTGLGLTISRRLARLMGGDLTAESEEGKGSTFTLWLPEASAAKQEAAKWRAEAPDIAGRLHGLGEIGQGLLRELAALVTAFVGRLRSEPLVPGALALRTTQLADHVGAYLADLASMLAAIEEARGQPSRLVADGAEIQLYVAERHGAQRARLGWTAEVMRREWAILGEELERVVRRVGATVPPAVCSEALLMLTRFLEQAEEQSLRALERGTQTSEPRDPA